MRRDYVEECEHLLAGGGFVGGFRRQAFEEAREAVAERRLVARPAAGEFGV